MHLYRCHLNIRFTIFDFNLFINWFNYRLNFFDFIRNIYPLNKSF